MPIVTQQDREALRDLRRAVNEARLAADARIRSYRNGLLIALTILTVVLIAIPFVVSELASDLATLRVADPATSSANTPPTWTDLGTVELWGMVGGLIGALVSLRRVYALRQPIGLHLIQLLFETAGRSGDRIVWRRPPSG